MPRQQSAPPARLRTLCWLPVASCRRPQASAKGRPSRAASSRAARSARVGAYARAQVANLVEGVTKGFEKKLEITGVGYRAAKDGQKLILSLGFSHQIPVEPLGGVSFEVGQDTATRRPFITILGIDKEAVGQQAAVIRKLKPPEPYKGKGIRYQGEIVRRKAGKSGKAGGKGGAKGGKK